MPGEASENDLSSKELEYKLNELYEEQSKSFRFAVFSGGGAKGAVYSGVIEALEDKNIINTLEGVSGSSAGAITAALFASGARSEDFKRILKENNLGKVAKGKLRKGLIINQDTSKLFEMINDNLNRSLYENMDIADLKNKCTEQLEDITEQIQHLQSIPSPSSETSDEINTLIKKQTTLNYVNEHPRYLEEFRKKLQNNDLVTFQELDILHALDPVKFKDLSVTAVSKSTGELTIFNATDFPNVPISKACLASASLPRLFQSVEIEGKKYVDGGYRDNIPQDIFRKAEEKIADIDSPEKTKKFSKDRILAFAFGDMDNPSNATRISLYSMKEKIHDTSKFMKFVINYVFKKFARVKGDFKHTDEKEKCYNKLRENAQNVVVLDTKITTLEFNKADSKSEILHANGRLATLRYLDNYNIGITDDRLEHKEFMLEVCQQIFDKFKADKRPEILSEVNHLVGYCNDDLWRGRNTEQMMKGFISEAAGISPKYLNVAIDVLNSNKVTSNVRKDYQNILEIKNTLSDKHIFKTEQFSEKFALTGKASKILSKKNKKLFKTKQFSEKSALQEKVSKILSKSEKPLEEKATNLPGVKYNTVPDALDKKGVKGRNQGPSR